MTRIGDTLAKRYTLEETLGRGASGHVFRATDVVLGIPVVVKVLHEGLSQAHDVLERFKRELLLARRLSHSGISKVFDMQSEGDTHFLVMELVEGETLTSLLKREKKLTVPRALEILRQAASAVGAAHAEGIVHRDLKPENLMIRPDGRVVVLDFGIATQDGLDRLTRPGFVLGSRKYMAPELWTGSPPTPQSDVWSLGVILYGALCGRLPYRADGMFGVLDAIKSTPPPTISSLNPGAARSLEDLVGRALRPEAGDRFPDARALERALVLESERGLEPTNITTMPVDVSAPTVLGQPTFMPPSLTGEAPAFLDEKDAALGDLPPPAVSRPQTTTPAPIALSSSAENAANAAPSQDASHNVPEGASDGDGTNRPRFIDDGGSTRLDGPRDVTIPTAESSRAANWTVFSTDAKEQVESSTAAPIDDNAGPMAEAAVDAAVDNVGESSLPQAEAPLTMTGAWRRASSAEVTPAPGGASEHPPDNGNGGGFHSDTSETPLDDLPSRVVRANIPTMLVRDDRLSPRTEDVTTPAKSKRAAIIVVSVVTALVLSVALLVLLSGDDDDAAVGQVVGGEDVTTDPAIIDDTKVDGAKVDDAKIEGTKTDSGKSETVTANDVKVNGANVDDGKVTGANDDDAKIEDTTTDDNNVESAVDAKSENDGDAEWELALGDDMNEDDAEPVDEASRDKDPSTARTAKKPSPSPEDERRKKQIAKLADQVSKAMNTRGLLVGDVRALDQERSRARGHLRGKRLQAAERSLDAALNIANTTPIDQALVSAKLARFNRRYDSVTDDAVKSAVGKTAIDIGRAMAKGDYTSANKSLNTGFQLMR